MQLLYLIFSTDLKVLCKTHLWAAVAFLAQSTRLNLRRLTAVTSIMNLKEERVYV